MSAIHACPATTKVACDHAQRLKPCAIAPVTPLRACAFAATAGRESGTSPGMTSCPSFHRAVFHALAFGIVRRDAPQFERRRPETEAEHDARGLGCRVRPDMRAGRGGGS